MNPQESLRLFYYFYPDDTPLRRLLLRHSQQVQAKALALLDQPQCASLGCDRALVGAGALLHDIGVSQCHAPGILCEGSAPYITHGIIGASMLRRWAADPAAMRQVGVWLTADDADALARICERHTGAGLSCDDIVRQSLPLPHADYLPETVEEKAVCLADKFFSKSGDMVEKPIAQVRAGMARFGAGTAERFEAMCALFHIG